MRTNENLARAAEHPSLRNSPQRVMAYSDSSPVRRTLVHWLRGSGPGWEVVEARSPQEALDLVIRVSPAVFVCGHDVGGSSGTDILASARSLHPELVGILLVGSHVAEESLERANLAGVFRKLGDPWRLDHLLELVGEALAEHGRRAELDRILSQYLSDEAIHPSCGVSAGFRPAFAPSGDAPRALPR